MRIKRVIPQTQTDRQYTAEYECEHCGHETQGYGWSDNNFRNNILPRMRCDRCGKNAKGEWITGTKTEEDDL